MRKILNYQPANLMRKTLSGNLKSIHIFSSDVSCTHERTCVYGRYTPAVGGQTRASFNCYRFQ